MSGQMQKQKAIGLFIGFGAVFLIAPSGCAGLKLQMFDHSVHKPSNVAVYFSVETRNGQPVANLTPQDFRIYEDRQPVSVLESKQTILNPEVAAIHYTLLLIDMSGSVVDSGDMPALIQAASTFGDRVGPYQKVAVYTFDGSPHLTPVVSFGGNVRAGVSALGSPPAARSVRPTSTARSSRASGCWGNRWSTRRCRCGSARWWCSPTAPTAPTAPARRMSTEALDAAGPMFETYVIGAGQEVDAKQLSRIGRAGTFASQNRADVQHGFDEIAARIEAASKKFYLLSYCSPSRAGEHEVEIEANGAGTSGRLGYRFNANGFGPNCDPNTRPPFDMKHPRQPAPEASDERPPSGGPPPAKAGPTWNPKR